MNDFRAFLSLCLLSLALTSPGAAADARHVSAGRTDMEITTKSSLARTYFMDGFSSFQRAHVEEGKEKWRKAAQEDPNFALAHIFLTTFGDPAEQASELDKALATKEFASVEEQLIIDWFGASYKAQWVPAIQAMNEALDKFGNHKQVLWLAGIWLLAQSQWARSVAVYERLIKIDPSFPDAWNSIAYGYARTRQFDKAFTAMERYTQLLPDESNPQDSLAEISRLAGRFEDALTHYRASLKIDPTFIASREGLADTYALMGDEPRARAEYALAIPKAPRVLSVVWGLQSATTYVRENDLENADLAFQAVATKAREAGIDGLAAESYRIMALYQKNSAKAKQLLDQATATVGDARQVAKEFLDQERSVILRTRIHCAIQDNDMNLANTALKELDDLSSSSSDASIGLDYGGSLAAILVAQGHYAEAIPHLVEDDRNPYSLRALMIAYEKTGAAEKAQQVAQQLAEFNEPTIEQALVVPAFRLTMIATQN